MVQNCASVKQAISDRLLVIGYRASVIGHRPPVVGYRVAVNRAFGAPPSRVLSCLSRLAFFRPSSVRRPRKSKAETLKPEKLKPEGRWLKPGV
jgi:hypothetical protein